MPSASGGGSALVLDTHVWVWLLDGLAERLSARCIAALRRGSNEGRLYVSPISVWEIGTLVAKGRLGLSMELRAWVERGLSAPGVRLAPFTPAIAMDSTQLPGATHGDPADRILIATARNLGGALVTRDAALIRYGKAGHVGVMDAA